MIELIFLPKADLEIQSAFTRYEDVQEGRGELFIVQLDAILTIFRSNPEMAPVYDGAYRRLLMRDFPYGIFYQAQAKRIIIAAVLDLRQDPATIRRNLFG